MARVLEYFYIYTVVVDMMLDPHFTWETSYLILHIYLYIYILGWLIPETIPFMGEDAPTLCIEENACGPE